MALKPDRIESHTDISFFMNEVATRGVVVVHDPATSGLGASMDDADNVVKLPDVTGGSGEKPAGVLLTDVVNLDLTRQHLNAHKNEVQIGGKVCLLKQGQVTTDDILSGDAPVPGDDAYFTIDGDFSTTSTNSTKIGSFLSSPDADGYCKVEINIT